MQPLVRCLLHAAFTSSVYDLEFMYALRSAWLLARDRGEDYKLFWPEKGEFIRLAVDSGAIIVPFSAVGIADR